MNMNMNMISTFLFSSLLIGMTNAEDVIFDICVDKVNFISAAQALATSDTANKTLDEILNGMNMVDIGGAQMLQMLQNMRGNNMFLEKLETIQSSSEFDDVFLQEYAMNLFYVALPAIILAVICLLCLPFCCYCHKCYCKQRMDSSDYSACQKFVPMASFLIISFASVALAIAGILQLGDLINGASGSICVFADFLLHMQDFFTNTSSVVFDLADNLVTGFHNVNVSLGGTNDVSINLDALSSELQNLSTDLSAYAIEMNSTFLSELAASVGDQQTNINNIASSLIQPLLSSRGSVLDQFVNAKDSLDLATDDAMGAMKSLNESIGYGAMEGFIVSAKDVGASYLNSAEAVAYTMFAFTFLSLFIGLVAVISFLTPCNVGKVAARVGLRISWGITFVFMIIFFILSGVLLPVGAGMSDMCGVLEVVPLNFSKYLGPLLNDGNQGQGNDPVSFDPFTVVQSCFSPDPVGMFESLDLSSSLGGVSSVFDDFDSVGSSLQNGVDLQSLYQFADELRSLTYANFSFDPTSVNTTLDQLNQITSSDGNVYTVIDCTPNSTCDEECLVLSTCASDAANPVANTNDATGLNNTRRALIELIATQAQLDTLMTMLDTAADGLDNTGEALNSTVIGLVSALGSLKTSVLDPVLNTLGRLYALSCGFIGRDFFATHGSLCRNTVSPLLIAAMYMFVIAVLAIAQVILIDYIIIRMFGKTDNRTAKVWVDTKDGPMK